MNATWSENETVSADGNVVALIDADGSGELSAIYDYDPFGNLIRATGEAASMNPFRFSSKYHLDYYGLYYYGFRYYSPSLGRFINRDPIKELGFLTTADESVYWMREEDLNDYGFVQNNPISRYDPLGLSSTENGESGKKCSNVCGPDVTNTLRGTISLIEMTFRGLARSDQRDVCNSIVSPGGWDIVGIRGGNYTRRCGESGACANTIWVDGGCHFRGSVNYVLYGTMFRLCRMSETWMWMTIWLYKQRAGNYGPSQDWAKAGFDGWPAASTPSPDRPDCKECGITSGLPHFHGFAGSGSPGIMHFGPRTIERP